MIFLFLEKIISEKLCRKTKMKQFIYLFIYLHLLTVTIVEYAIKLRFLYNSYLYVNVLSFSCKST